MNKKGITNDKILKSKFRHDLEEEFLIRILLEEKGGKSIISSWNMKQLADPSVPVSTLCCSASIDRYSTPHQLWYHYHNPITIITLLLS